VPDDDPLRLYLVLRRGAFEALEPAGELAGAAAIACVRAYAGDPDLEAWRPRPGKVCLRARNLAQWEQLLEEERPVVAGDPEGAAVAAIPPRRRSERGPLLERLQAMSSALEPPPRHPDPADDRQALTYVLNPRYAMSSGKTLAQIAHAAVEAADTGALEAWIAAGCPARVVRPSQDAFTVLCADPGLVARIEDAGFTEVPPGTVTVVALPPAPAASLPVALA
jgi:peptidyl-tRNA hydrolase